MKINMTFNMPDDKDDFTLANKGRDFWYVLWEMDQWLRGKVKYAPEGEDEKITDTYQACRDHLHELMNGSDVTLDCVS